MYVLPDRFSRSSTRTCDHVLNELIDNEPSILKLEPRNGHIPRDVTIVGFGETRIHAETATFELRASEVANPRPDDQLIVDGQTFLVQGEPERRDPDQLVWTLDVRPA